MTTSDVPARVAPSRERVRDSVTAAVTGHRQDTRAEYKQVTVLFADVVHSMDIAAAVGAERLREIMAELADRARQWCSGTAARWTSSPATASWPCSVRQSRWRTTPFVPVWRPWAFRRRPRGSLPKSKTATVWTSGCAWA